MIGITNKIVCMSTSFVYILTNNTSTVFYTGVTSELAKRIAQHRNKSFGGFSAKYDLNRVVYIEELPNITDAIKREKYIKMMSRVRKIKLINSVNPEWENLL